MPTRRKKGFSASQSKLTSRRLRTATFGTHTPQRSSTKRSHMNGDAVSFSSSRKNKRAQRGIIDTVIPTTKSGESSAQYAQRVSRREFTQEIQRKARVRRIIAILICVVVAVAAACAVGAFALFSSLDGKIALKNSDATTALVSPTAAQPYYALVVADLDEVGTSGADAAPEVLALVRVDEATPALTVVTLPVEMRVTATGGAQTLAALATQGDATLINAVSSFAEVDIAHIVKSDAAGLTSLVDAAGGISVDVPEEVDDPSAGDVYIAEGAQQLDGRATLTLLRAANFSDGLTTQALNQRLVAGALAQALSGGTLDTALLLDRVAGSFQTDATANDATALAGAMSHLDANNVQGALVPGYETTRDGSTYYVASSDEWTTMMAAVEAGENPQVEHVVANVDPASFTITVRNGSEITGAAAQFASMLTQRGFKVEETGNVDVMGAYDETLVVYNNDDFEAAAQTVVSSLGTGRTVAGMGYYTFETDVLVVVGKDWKPVA